MKIINRLVMIAAVSLAVGCGGAAKDDKGEINDKKVELQKLKDQQGKIALDIKKLESEIALLDPSSVEVKPKLVAASSLAVQDFTHYIDLQGRIETENIYYVTPRGGPGQVKSIYVKEGDYVKKGQLVLKLDDVVMLQSIRQLETQLAYAKDLLQRQKNLWDQGIGTEVQYLNAKNNVENLEKQISILKEQWNYSNVHSEVSGVVETVNIRVGETFTGAPLQGITIVNPSSLKAVVDVPEAYLSKIRKGAPVLVEIPDLNKTFKTTISLVSQLINPNSRGFMAEAKIPAGFQLKPNTIAMIRIQDYTVSNTIVIPVNTLQTDETGKYVYVTAEEKGKKVARKRTVQVGELYGDKIEVKKGLTTGDQLITEGYQGLYEGQAIQVEVK